MPVVSGGGELQDVRFKNNYIIVENIYKDGRKL